MHYAIVKRLKWPGYFRFHKKKVSGDLLKNLIEISGSFCFGIREGMGIIHEYLTFDKTGVDIKEFYHAAGVSVLEVSREVGISRQSATAVPLRRARKENAQKALDYMERKSRERYRRNTENAWENCIKTLEEEWEQYRKAEELMERCRSMYGFARNYPPVKKLTPDNLSRKRKIAKKTDGSS